MPSCDECRGTGEVATRDPDPNEGISLFSDDYDFSETEASYTRGPCAACNGSGVVRGTPQVRLEVSGPRGTSRLTIPTPATPAGRFSQADEDYSHRLTSLGTQIMAVNRRVGAEHHNECPMGMRMRGEETPNCTHGMDLCVECHPCDCGHSIKPFEAGDVVKLRLSPHLGTGIIVGHSPKRRRFEVSWTSGKNRYEQRQLQRVLPCCERDHDGDGNCDRHHG